MVRESKAEKSTLLSALRALAPMMKQHFPPLSASQLSGKPGSHQ